MNKIVRTSLGITLFIGGGMLVYFATRHFGSYEAYMTAGIGLIICLTGLALAFRPKLAKHILWLAPFN